MSCSHDTTARLWACDMAYPLRIFAGHTADVNVSEWRGGKGGGMGEGVEGREGRGMKEGRLVEVGGGEGGEGGEVGGTKIFTC